MGTNDQRFNTLLEKLRRETGMRLRDFLTGGPLHADRLAAAVMDCFPRLSGLPQESACDRGCAFCCHLRVGVSIPEAVTVFQALSSSATPEGFVCFKKRILETARNPDVTKESWWLTSQTPCPFLSDQEPRGCLIYDIRPFSCRGYHSTDLQACKAAYESKQKTEIPCFPRYRYFAGMYSEQLIQISGEFGLFSGQVGFIKSLAMMFEDPDRICRWLCKEDVFRPAVL